MRTDPDDIRTTDVPYRTDVTYKRRSSWVAPVLVLLAIAGLGWWVVSSTRDDIALLPDDDRAFTPTAPADRGLPNAGVAPAPVVPPAATPAPIVPAPAVPGGGAGFGGNMGAPAAPITPPAAAPDALAAMTQTTNGRVDEYDPLRRTLTLENGDTFLLAANVPGADTLTPGQTVTLTYRLDGDQKVIQNIVNNLAPAPAPDVAPRAPMAPGAVPLPLNP